MRRLNIRLIIILSVSALALGVMVLLLQRWQVGRNIDGLLRRAELAEEAGETDKAISLLSRYTQQQPDDTQAFTRMALLVEQRTHERRIERNEYNSTWQLLEKAIRQDPDNDKLRRATIDFFLRYGRFKDAAEHLAAQLQRDPNDAELQFRLARAHIGGTTYDQAAELLEILIGYNRTSDDFDPARASGATNIQAYELLAAIEREHRRRPRQSDRVMQQCVTANDHSATALLARGRYLLQHHRADPMSFTQAKTDIRRAAELSPNDAAVIATIADLEIADGNIEKANDWLQHGIDTFPSNETFYRQRAKLAIQQNEAATAMRFIEAGLNAVPDSWSLLLMQAELDLAAGEIPRVKEAVNRLLGDERMRLLGEYLHARVLLTERRWAPCSEQLETLLPKLMARRPDLGPQACLALAQCYEQLGQPDRQREANRQLLEIEPTSIAGHFSESRAQLRLGRTDQARQSLIRAQQIAKQRGLILTELTNWETALLAAEQRAQPKDEREIAEIERRFVAALESRDDLTTEQKTAARVRFLMQQEQLPRAAEMLEKALEHSPDDVGLRLASVDLTQLQEGSAAAMKLLNALKESQGDSVELRLREAVLLASDSTDDLGTQLGKLENDIQQFSATEHRQLWQGLGAIHRNLGNTKDALRLWQNVADANPDDVATRMSMFDLVRATRDATRMKALSEEIASIAGGDSPYAKLTEAIRLLDMVSDTPNAEQIATARRLANEAQSQRPNWHALSLLQADLDLREGHIDAAIDHLQIALKQGSVSPRTVRKLVELLWSQKRFDEARKAMATLGQSGEMNLADVRLKSRTEFAGGELGDATALARRAAKDSQDAGDHLWLAQLLSRGEKPEAAIPAFQRTVELAPDNEPARLALVRQLLLADMREEASAEVQRMQIDLPPDRVDSAMGVAYELLGEPLLARKHFEQAVAARPDDAAAWRDLAAFHLLAKDNQQAMMALEKLLLLPTTSDEDAPQHFAWARRTKAELVGASGRYDDFQAAVKLLRQNKRAGSLTSADLLVLANMTLPRSDPFAMQDAIKEFETARQQRQLSNSEQLALARLLEAVGDWPRCEKIMTSLVAQADGNATIVAAWCEMKLRRDDINGVEQFVRQLDQASPVALQLRARLYAAQGRDERAIEVVRSLVPAADANNRNATMLALARFLEELELPSEAEKFYRTVAKASLSARINLADFLARNGELDEAFDLCDGELTDENIIGITRIGIMGLTAQRGNAPPDALQYARVASWLERGLRDLPRSKGMLLNDVFFQELRENYDEAIELYRQYLGRKDLRFHERAIAANNLAMILAGQGNCGDAQALIDEAIQLVGPTVAMLDTRAMVALCDGDQASVTRAIDELELATAASREPVIAFHLAIALYQAEQIDDAEEAMRKAIDDGLNPRQLSSWDRTHYATLSKDFGIDRDAQRPLQSPK